jgi:hypothetical protein
MKHGFLIALMLMVLGCKSNNFNSTTIKSDSSAIKFEFSPKQYELNKIDTLINDSIRLVVDRYTLMNSYVTPYGAVANDSTVYAYRDYAFDVSLFVNDSLIVKKNYLKDSFGLDKDFLKESIIYGVWFDSYDKLEKELKLIVGIGVEDSDNVERFVMAITLFGKIEIDEMR